MSRRSNFTRCSALVELLETAAQLTEQGIKFCNASARGLLCWPPTPVGKTVYLSCNLIPQKAIESLECFELKTGATADHTCDSNGQWTDLNVNRCYLSEGGEVLRQARWIYHVGFTLSAASLLVAIGVIVLAKQLNCARNKIHFNLFISSWMSAVSWLIWMVFVEHTLSSPLVCSTIFLIHRFWYMTTFFWMFCEGLHLLFIIAVPFLLEKIRFRVFWLIGWLLPLLFTSIWATYGLIYHFNIDCCINQEDRYDLLWLLYNLPICTTLFLNLIFFVVVIVTLMRKIFATHNMTRNVMLPNPQYRRAARGTLVLVPLLGISYLLFLVEPSADSYFAYNLYHYMNASFVALRGCFIALCYCFLNAEIRNALKRRIMQWMPSRRLGEYVSASGRSRYVPDNRSCAEAFQPTYVAMRPVGNAAAPSPNEAPHRQCCSYKADPQPSHPCATATTAYKVNHVNTSPLAVN